MGYDEVLSTGDLLLKILTPSTVTPGQGFRNAGSAAKRRPKANLTVDLNGSGLVGFSDLLQLLSIWGPCTGCPEDLDGSGAVDFSDLLEILSSFWACPQEPRPPRTEEF